MESYSATLVREILKAANEQKGVTFLAPDPCPAGHEQAVIEHRGREWNTSDIPVACPECAASLWRCETGCFLGQEKDRT